MTHQPTTTRDIERDQAVTRWVEGCKERSRGKTRGPGIKPTDAEFVAEHIQLQAEEAAGLLASLRRVAKQTKDGAWVVPGDRVWITTTRGPRWFRLQFDFTVPISIANSHDDGPVEWRDLGVEDCYSTHDAAAEACQ